MLSGANLIKKSICWYVEDAFYAIFAQKKVFFSYSGVIFWSIVYF